MILNLWVETQQKSTNIRNSNMAAAVLGVALWQLTTKSEQWLPNQEDGQLLPYVGSYETSAILNWSFCVSPFELNQSMASQFLPISTLSTTVFCLTLFTLCLVPGLRRHLSFSSGLSDHYFILYCLTFCN